MDMELLKAFIAGQVRHVMTILAGTLVTYGFVQAGDQNSFIQISSGIVLAGVAMAWSWWQKKGQAQVAALLKKPVAKK